MEELENTPEPGSEPVTPSIGGALPSEASLSLLQKIVLKHKDYGFTPGNYAKKQLAELVDAELLINHGAHYSVSVLGIEVFATL